MHIFVLFKSVILSIDIKLYKISLFHYYILSPQEPTEGAGQIRAHPIFSIRRTPSNCSTCHNTPSTARAIGDARSVSTIPMLKIPYITNTIPTPKARNKPLPQSIYCDTPPIVLKNNGNLISVTVPTEQTVPIEYNGVARQDHYVPSNSLQIGEEQIKTKQWSCTIM